MEWAVSIGAEVGADIAGAETIFDELLPLHAAVAVGTDRLDATFTVEAGSVEAAVAVGVEVFVAATTRASLDVEILCAEALTLQEQERRLSTPSLPELIGVAELAEILGVSRQRASELARRSGFPRPVSWLAAGPIWVRSSVDRFVAAWPRRPGRPRKLATLPRASGHDSA